MTDIGQAIGFGFGIRGDWISSIVAIRLSFKILLCGATSIYFYLHVDESSEP